MPLRPPTRRQPFPRPRESNPRPEDERRAEGAASNPDSEPRAVRPTLERHRPLRAPPPRSSPLEPERPSTLSEAPERALRALLDTAYEVSDAYLEEGRRYAEARSALRESPWGPRTDPSDRGTSGAAEGWLPPLGLDPLGSAAMTARPEVALGLRWFFDELARALTAGGDPRRQARPSEAGAASAAGIPGGGRAFAGIRAEPSPTGWVFEPDDDDDDVEPEASSEAPPDNDRLRGPTGAPEAAERTEGEPQRSEPGRLVRGVESPISKQ